MSQIGRKLAPGPGGHLLLGKLLDVRRDRLGFVTGLRRDFGDIVRFRMGSRILFLISHPDHVRYVLHDNQANYKKGVGLAEARKWLGDGLVTSEGAVWARQRKMIQPAFHRSRIAAFSSAVTEATAVVIAQWRESAERGHSIELSSQLMQLTLSVIARVMFTTDITNAGEVGAAFAAALRDAMDRMTAIMVLPDWMPFPGKRRFRKALKTLDAVVYSIIQEHRNGGGRGDDLVSRLLSERDDMQNGFDDGEIRDQVMTILLAGHETTASSIAWTFHLLAQYPDVWDRMRAEVDEVLGGRTPTHDDVPRLVWTRMVYEESLRLYPPVWLIPRRALADDEIGGYYIPRDADALICPYVIHRHPRYWPDPDAFDPNRFSSAESAARQHFSYLPFGAGQRACVGKSLAMMEAILIMVMIAQTFRLQSVPGHPVVPEPLLTLRFRHGIAMRPFIHNAA